MLVSMRRWVFILLCVVTFLVPWEELLRIPGFTTGIFLISAGALGLSLLVLILRSRMRRLPLIPLVLGVFAFWSAFSLLWSSDPRATVGIARTYVSLLLLVWMLWEFVDTRTRFLWVLRSYFLGCCVSISLLFASYFGGKDAGVLDSTRYTGGGLNQNSFALIMNIGIVVAAYLATSSSSRWRSSYWVFMIPACLSVLLTGSRTGAIGLAAAIGTALVISWSRSGRSLAILLLALACAAWYVPSVVPDSLLSRVAEGTGTQTFTVRETQWRLGLGLWEEHPVTGVGAGAFIASAAERGGRPMVAHNTYIQILADGGTVGIALMLAVWALLLQRVWGLPARERVVWLGAGFVWALSAVTLSLEYYKITWLLYSWIIVQPVCLESCVFTTSAPEDRGVGESPGTVAPRS